MLLRTQTHACQHQGETASMLRQLGHTLPPIELADDVACLVTVLFPNGLVLSSTTPLVTLLGTRDPAYDHDGDGVHDRCDPDIYDFADDALATRSAGTSQVNRATPGFEVVDAGGSRAAHYANASASTVSDRFERLRSDTSHQDLTAFLDFDATAQRAHVEFWSDGSYAGNSGAGLLFQVTSAGELRLYQRVRRSLPVTVGPALPTSGRLRLRLIKGPVNTSATRTTKQRSPFTATTERASPRASKPESYEPARSQRCLDTTSATIRPCAGHARCRCCAVPCRRTDWGQLQH